MKDLPTRPFLAIYVAWHPNFTEGAKLARALFDHYRRNLYQNVAGGSGIPVLYRSEPAPRGTMPIDVDLDSADTCAVVVLMDENLIDDPNWVAWVKSLSAQTDSAGLKALLFPVTIDASALETGISDQAVRWDLWKAEPVEVRQRRLFTGLSYQFCRMLRHYLEH